MWYRHRVANNYFLVAMFLELLSFCAHLFNWCHHSINSVKGATLVKNLSAKEPSALGLDTYTKQYYLCLASAAATVKWYVKK